MPKNADVSDYYVFVVQLPGETVCISHYAKRQYCFFNLCMATSLGERKLKSVKLRPKIDLVSHPDRGKGLVKTPI